MRKCWTPEMSAQTLATTWRFARQLMDVVGLTAGLALTTRPVPSIAGCPCCIRDYPRVVVNVHNAGADWHGPRLAFTLPVANDHKDIHAHHMQHPYGRFIPWDRKRPFTPELARILLCLCTDEAATHALPVALPPARDADRGAEEAEMGGRAVPGADLQD